jgi:hypothetical protein
MRTSSLLAKRPLKPRHVMAHLFASSRATCIPGAIRSASGMNLAPDRRMSSGRMTNTAEGVFIRLSSFRAGVVISTCISSSMLRPVRSFGS